MNLDHLPERLTSSYGQTVPNEDICVREVVVRATLGNEEFSGPGSLFLTWNPSPRLVIRTEITPDPDAAVEYIVIGGKTELAVDEIEADWIMTQSSPIAGITFQTTPAPVSGLTEVRFHLVNFADYIGTKTRVDSTTISTSRLTLNSDEWQVVLDSLESSRENAKLMNRTGGYAITHVGVLRHPSGNPFSSDNAQRFLRNVVRFLSFAQGRWTLPVIVDGFDVDGKLTWTNVAPLTNNDSWRYADSWFDKVEAVELLPPVFKGFMKRIEQPQVEEALSRAVYWYLLANSVSAIETSVILVQAALELLAWHVLVMGERISRSKYNGNNTDEKIRLLISHCEIPAAIPPGLPELANYANARKVDGPGAITLIRNQIIHPRKTTTSIYEIIEARQIGLWYIELVILRLCKYSGRYASRVAGRIRYAGQLVPVPWATSTP